MGFFFQIILFLTPFFLIAVPGTLAAADFALDFDGTDDYVDLGKNSSLNLGTNFEITFSIKFTGTGLYSILQRGTDAIDAQYWYIQSLSDGSGKLEFQISDGIGFALIQTSVAVNDGEWHEVIWTRSGNTHTVKVDGTDRTITGNIDPDIGDINNSSRNIYIGAEIVNSEFYYSGSVDGVKIVVGGTTKGLWYFDDGSGATLADSSGNGNNGTVSGAAWVAGTVAKPAEAPAPAPRVSVSGGPIASRPEVEITGPGLGKSFHYIVDIDYNAADKNDESALESERKNFGLGAKPVSIYYSETSDVRKRTLIASGLPAGPRYQWDAAAIPDGSTYRVIVEAKDNFGEISEAISNSITIDHTPPVFKIKVDPPFSRGEDVKITIDVNEKLQSPPEVFIRQRGFRPVPLEITGGEQYLPTLGQIVRYEGVYQVIKGYDGPARINISGKDRAGLVGTTITSGDTFSIGIDTPPSPIITEPLNNDIIKDELITVKGKGREDTDLTLTVNGQDKYNGEPDENGDFIFKDVRVKPEFNRGTNFLSIISVDSLGNISAPAEINVSFNKKPDITIIKPQTGETIQGETNIIIEALDRNDDPLLFTYEVSGDDGQTWEILARKIPAKKVAWPTADRPDGPYILRIIADDGIAESEVVSGKFSVLNFLPIIKFDREEQIVISRTAFELSGQVVVQKLGRRPLTIKALEYSSNNGASWTSIAAKDGEFDSADEKFIFELKGLADGFNKILFRAKDSRGFYGKTAKNIIVDFGPPDAPRINEPGANSIIANSQDENAKKAGVQITIKGLAEAGATIRVVSAGEVSEVEAGQDGGFTIKGVTLREHGKNDLTAVVIDPAKNQSPAATFSYILNNPPDIKFISPRSERGLNHTASIEWRIGDPDGDNVSPATLSYRRSRNSPFVVLLKDEASETYRWDVSGFPEGDSYQLKLEATDGVSPAEKIIDITIDHTPPKVFLTPLDVNYFKKEFNLTLLGSASDNFSGIETAEYSLDNEHWFKAIITDGFGERSAQFRIKHPFILEDGSYSVKVRAVDFSGNISASVSQDIIVDTSAPRIGSFLLKSGFNNLITQDQKFALPEGEIILFSISLEDDAVSAVLGVGNKKINLAKVPAIGLWQTDISVDVPGEYPIAVSAGDRFGNEVLDFKLAEIISKPRPKVYDKENSAALIDAEIHILIFNDEENRWASWQAEEYGGKNPIATNANGEYRLFLPGGQYRLSIRKKGYTRLSTKDLKLDSPAFITDDFALEKRAGVRGFVENIIEKITF